MECINTKDMKLVQIENKKMRSKKAKRIPSVGIEPTTLGLLDPRSNQLSYEGFLTILAHFESPHHTAKPLQNVININLNMTFKPKSQWNQTKSKALSISVFLSFYLSRELVERGYLSLNLFDHTVRYVCKLNYQNFHVIFSFISQAL